MGYCIDFISKLSRWTYPFYFKAMIEWPFLFLLLLYRKTLPTQLSVFFESDSNFDSGQNSKERDLSQNFVSRLFSLKEKTSSLFHFSSTCTICTCTLSHKLFLKCEKVFEYQTQRVQNFQDGFTSSLSICKNTFGKYHTFIGFDSFWI